MECEQGEPIRNLDRIASLTSMQIGKAADREGGARGGLEEGLHGGKLYRLPCRDGAGADVSRDRLEHCGWGSKDQRCRQRATMECVGAVEQEQEGVNPSDRKSSRGVCGDGHV